MSTKYIPAGAGSGKTHKLTHDLADMLARGEVEASRVILTTFTRSAAADFMRRAREVLINENHDPAKAAELDGALIGTVHSVCERFIRKYWYRLDLNLPLNIMSDADKKLFISRTTENVASDDDIKFFSGFAQEFELDPGFWKGSLESIIDKRYSFDVRNLNESCRLSCEDIDRIFSVDAKLTDDKVFDTFFKRMFAIFVQESTKTAAGIVIQMRDSLRSPLFLKAKKIRSIINIDDSSVCGVQRNWKKLTNSGYTDAELASLYRLAGDCLVSREVGAKMKECVQKLFRLAGSWEKEFKQFKVENRLLDFNDLEQLFLRILDEDEFEDVRRDIRSSYRVLMVDEFQDSNPVQIRIFRRMKELVGAPESHDDGSPVFREVEFVGDWKQAIYGFRGTESSLVEEFIHEIKDQKPLKKSYRSRKDLVQAANEIFCKAFSRKKLPVVLDDDAPYDGVSLLETRNEPDGMDPALQHWNSPGDKNNYAAVGKKIHDLVESKTCMVVRKKDDEGNEVPEPIDYGDIAILLRNGYAISEVADAFQKADVPVSILESDFIAQAEVQLILSLVRYVSNADDKGAKADILRLMDGMETEDVIKGSISGQWSDEVGNFFEKLKSIRSRVSVLSISEIVESLVLETGFFTNVTDWGWSDTRVRNIGFICALAAEYENQCSNINVSPTLPGFISYVCEYKPDKRPVDKTDTVKILTYHNAKGLDWPMVILDELDSFKTDDQEVISKGFKGVQNYRRKDSGEVLLHLFPTILSKQASEKGYARKQSMPDVIVERIKKTDLFDYVKERRVKEERRLLYVGFTRAKDYLVTLGNSKSVYTWLTNCGAAAWEPDVVNNPKPVGNRIILWDSSYPSTYFDIKEPDHLNTQEDRQPRAWEIPGRKNYDDKFKSPSTQKTDSLPAGEKKDCPVHLSEVFRGEKMMQDIKEDSARCGTCIHRIFAAYDPDADRKEMVEMARRIIEGMELTQEFPSPESVIDSAAQLFDWLKKEYGDGTALHELPVLMKQPDGTVIRGEMDLVWALPGGKCVLVDYKSFHGGEDIGTIKAHAVQHGYPGQLKAYKDTLESGECQVRDVFIYYFVLGQVIRFEFKNN